MNFLAKSLLHLVVCLVFLGGNFSQAESKEKTNWSPELNKLLNEAFSDEKVALKTEPMMPAGAVPINAQRNEYRILLDPGHGGADLGAQGLYQTSEKKLCQKVVTYLKAKLLNLASKVGRPLEIRLSRKKDEFVTLKERVRMANEWDADLFVSVHANASFSKKAKGFELYFLSTEASDKHTRNLVKTENQAIGQEPLKSDVLSILSDFRQTYHIAESARFAEVLYKRMAKTIKPNVRGVRQGPFRVLSGTTMPAILVEIGYVTNPTDARLLTKASYLKQLANAIGSGIMDYLEQMKRLRA